MGMYIPPLNVKGKATRSGETAPLWLNFSESMNSAPLMKTKTERKGSPTDIQRRDQRTDGLSGASGRPQVKAGQKQVKLLLHYPPALGGHINRDFLHFLCYISTHRRVCGLVLINKQMKTMTPSKNVLMFVC